MAVQKKGIQETFYISHGSPTISIDDSLPARPFLKSFRHKILLEKPKTILVNLGHWETSEPAVNAISGLSETIYDFYRFPDKMYQPKFPASGSSKLANSVKQLLINSGFETVHVDKECRLDHGVWVLLMLMYPDVDIPVCQLSVQTHKDAAHHYRLGRALTSLKDINILIIGSGAAIHNLSTMNRNSDVNEYAEKAPHAQKTHLSPDHFYMLHVVLGAAGENTRGVANYKPQRPLPICLVIGFPQPVPPAFSRAPPHYYPQGYQTIPDMIWGCLEGLAQALRVFNGVDTIPAYKVASISMESMLKVHVKPETPEVRPFIVCVVLRGVTFDKA
ncbi:hypothetical protein ACS0TY_020418 [Phlomoides rotata]